MALDIQTVALVNPESVPFERPTNPVALWTPIPRALFTFHISIQLDAKAATDTALLNLDATFPPGFAYIFADLNLTIRQDRAFEWSLIANLNLQNFFRAHRDVVALNGNYTVGMASSAIDGSQLTLQQSSFTNPWPKMIMVPTEGTVGILTRFTAWNANATNAAAVGTIDYWISMYQYDLEQIRKFPINTLLPVR